MESKPSNPDLDSPIHRPHPILVASKLSIPKGPGHALDNDPRRFLNHLIASIRGESGSFGEALLPSLESIRLPSPGHLSSLVAGEISNLAHPLSVVLDDYHEIQNPHVHECVEELIRFQPRNLHLVILTRVDPPFPLTRYSVEGRMTELRADDLRFNEEDTRQFLELSSGNSIGRSAAAALCEKTEGWPAALQLCALSLRKADSQSVKAFVANFNGQDRYIVDYLLEEVLNRQPAGIIDFLLDTSVLDRFNSDI
ncbi:MAG: hypothetical protein JSV89_07670 [Spirochaetaceae bacterium]|nr:MAG: hypothetical protein JSV89_07670 [Spirochaetaceae bacterium]